MTLTSRIWPCFQYHALAMLRRWRTPNADHCFPHWLPSPHPFATWDPTAQSKLMPPVSAPNSTCRGSDFQHSPMQHGGALSLRHSQTHSWDGGWIEHSDSWDVVPSCVRLVFMVCLQCRINQICLHCFQRWASHFGCSETLHMVSNPTGCAYARAQRRKFKWEGAHQVTSSRVEEK